MKKILNLGILIVTLSVPILASEKSRFQRRMHIFTQKMRDRHTYELNSFEHKRDSTLLWVLPSSISQAILTQQRSNMQKFLEQNEANALASIKNDFNFTDQEWSTILGTIDKEISFNLKAMQQEGNNKGIHDPSLPKAWVDALESECKRHQILPENLTFKKIKQPHTYANARSIRPLLEIDAYFPTEIGFNFCYSRLHLRQIAAHEIVHATKNHGLICQVILDKRFDILGLIKILKNNSMQFLTNQNPFDYIYNAIALELEKPAYKKLCQAQEKTADTLIACTDPEYAHDYTNLVRNKTLSGIYPANHNDIMVLDANWKLSQKIEKHTQWNRAKSTKSLQKFPLKFSGLNKYSA